MDIRRHTRMLPRPSAYSIEAPQPQLTGADAEIYKLSTSFITNRPYTLPDLTMIDPEGAHIIRQGLLASKYIDDLPDPVH